MKKITIDKDVDVMMNLNDVHALINYLEREGFSDTDIIRCIKYIISHK